MILFDANPDHPFIEGLFGGDCFAVSTIRDFDEPGLRVFVPVLQSHGGQIRVLVCFESPGMAHGGDVLHEMRTWQLNSARAAILSLGVALTCFGDDCTVHEVHAAGLQAMIMLNAPSDFGVWPDEHIFEIDDYFPHRGPRARVTGDTRRRDDGEMAVGS